MLTLFAGSIPDLNPILTEERIPEHWEPRVRSRFGLTMAKFNWTVILVGKGINTKKVEELEADGRPKADNGEPAPAQATVQDEG
jgi:hypothetical protein